VGITAEVSDIRTTMQQNDSSTFQKGSMSDESVARLVGYCRISTDEQCTDMQVDALHAAGCATIYTDKGISGNLARRPQLDRMLKALRRGDCIVVWKLDRLGRSLRHLLELLEDLHARGVAFRSLTEAIDTTSPAGRMMMSMIGACAQYERDMLIQARTASRACIQARRRSG
jgi:DNA invertase Pin-like site-specific DNA recombinase